jgi:hypothetical protein
MEGIAGGVGKSWQRSGAKQKSKKEAADALDALKKKAHNPAKAAAVKPLKLEHDDTAPEFVPPQLATLVTKPPLGRGVGPRNQI